MAIEYAPLINGREYGWGDIIINLGGSPVTGIRGIKYGQNQEKEDIYGAGRNVVSRGYGRISCTASITLLAGTVFSLQQGAPKGQLHRIHPFPITVVYQPTTGPMVTDVLKNAEVKSVELSWVEGDMSKEVELELIISEIVRK
jgi:hypothetical protein